MAYAATVTWQEYRIGPRRGIILKIVELEAGAATEWQTLTGGSTSVSGPLPNSSEVPIPQVGRILLYQATASASTIQPRMGKATGWSASTQDDIGGQGSAAAYVNDATPLVYSFAVGQARTLFGKSVVGTSTTTVNTLIVIEEGAA